MQSSSEEKRRLLARFLQKKALSETKSAPLSFAQQRLWFLHQLEPESPFYTISLAFHLKGPLRVDVLERSLQDIVRRHETLRTTIKTVDDHPHQVIAPVSTLSLIKHDARALARAEREKSIQWQIQQEVRYPFDLSTGPLLRLSLFQLEEEEHILLLVMHHIVSDGWSMNVLMGELTRLYTAYLHDRPSPLLELPIQYADFAIWQREWLQGAVLAEQLAYWKQQLAGAPTVLALPTDHPRPAIQTFCGASQHLVLSEKLAAKLRQLSQQEGITLFMTLLAAFQIVLYRYTGQEDLVIGTPIANRMRKEVEGLIGFFVNTLVLRTKLAGNPSVREQLARIREVALGAYAHQDLPFEMLVEELRPERTLSYNPLFQVMIALDTSEEQWEWSGIKYTLQQVEQGTAQFDLVLYLEEGKQGLRGRFEYSTALFEAKTIARMAGHLQRVLEEMVADPDQRLQALPLLTHAEYEQVVEEWNRTQVVYSQQRCVHELFEEQVERTPEAVAVIYEEAQMTYREINARSNQLAHYLRVHGVGPEVRVGICVERSLEMIIGLLGILKAGGAYVPLDPTYPQERLTFMLKDARASLVLSEYALLGNIVVTDIPVFCLDRDWPALFCEPEENPVSGVIMENLAYSMYTSGSTGIPKGVMVSHANVCRLFATSQKSFQFDQNDIWTLFHSFSFDFSVWEIWGALLYGGRLIVVPRIVSRSPESFAALLSTQSVTVLNQTPSAFRQLVLLEKERDWVKGLALRWMIFGGESLEAQTVKTWFERYGETQPQLVNMYGITETTVHATFCPLHAADVEHPTGSIIGRPLDDLQIYVLDDYQQPVPVGVPGEMYVGGAGLARGYLDRPQLTSERFVAHPFNKKAGERLYKTGDKARLLSDGRLEYLGRKDQQVKIRGFRIESGEIEAQLGSLPQIKTCVVILREDEPGEKRLVAYVLMHDGTSFSSGELYRSLLERLPDYMIPSAFVQLETLPLTAQGKLDRSALPAPDHIRPDLEDAYMPPRTPSEEILAMIWTSALKIDRIGIHDNFFALGGHSLLALHIVLRIRERLLTQLPLRSLFEAPTIAKLAELIALTRREGERPLPIVQVDQTRTLLLSFAQRRMWFLQHLDLKSAFYNVPYAIRLTGSLQLEVLERSLAALIERHAVLRTDFVSEQGQPVQARVVASNQLLSLPVMDLSVLPEELRQTQMQTLIQQEASRPFNLELDPLLRVRILRLRTDDHILLLILHHIICDGWSIEILFRELSIFYQAFILKQSVSLPSLPIQYGDYAFWQQGQLHSAVIEQQLAYWKRQLADVPDLLQLPTDHPRPAVSSFRGAQYHFEVPASVVHHLKDWGQQEGATLFMVLLAAFLVLLQRYSQREDMVVGIPIAGRNRRELEGLIGLFINTLVIRVDLTDNPTMHELIGRVRETVLAAFEHQDVPFERVVEEVQPGRDLSHNPLFQVLFTLQNISETPHKFVGLTSTIEPIDTDTAKFDLTLDFEETETRLRGRFEYSTDLFEAETIARMTNHLQRVLEEMVADPDQRLRALPLLTQAEYRQVMEEWNQTQVVYPQQRCVHELFEEQAERTPDAVALVSGEQQLTYQALNQWANQVARWLRSQGAKHETLVGICMERGPEMVIGLLGILKAGAAYLPLHFDYPISRLAFMLEETEAVLLLTQEQLVPRLSELPVQIACIEACQATSIVTDVDNMGVRVEPCHLAYVIYTSGSTGKPKGVLVEHRMLVNLLHAMEPIGITSQDTLLAVTTISFDIAALELFLPLLVGARIAIASSVESSDGVSLAALLDTYYVNVMQATPITWRLLLEAGWQGSKGLRVLCGGEALSSQIACQLLPRSEALWNLYGPTETTIWSVIQRMTVDACHSAPPIGRPIANTNLYILDTNFQPVPIGVTGELYIGGAGVTRGYLGRPAVTAERFVPHPFSQEPGVRLYKTGDFTRYLPDGSLEYLGRIDQQVKLRGFRIELGEIEAALREHPGVQNSVVVAREDQSGLKRLVAYIVSAHTVREIQPHPADMLASQERLTQWQSTWDETYHRSSSQEDATFNISGWNSSYTGLPISAEEMHEWVNQTVRRLLSLNPRRILEIGCGTGLLFFRLALQCLEYQGTDISAQALHYLQAQLTKNPLLPQPVLLHRSAHQFEGIRAGILDTIILNSVVQYFPSIEYLKEVLEKAVQVIQPGGRIFVGDVRSLPLLEVFHTSVQLTHASDDFSITQLKRSIQKSLTQEHELVIDPRFFTALQQHLPQISQVQVLLKRGRFQNELTAFRYDVLLHVGQPIQHVEVPSVDWQRERLTVSAIRLLLEKQAPETLRVTNIPNARVAQSLQVIHLLAGDQPLATVGELRKVLQTFEGNGVEPEALWSLSEQVMYDIDLTWSADGQDGCFEVQCRRRGSTFPMSQEVCSALAPEIQQAVLPWKAYANNPLQVSSDHQLQTELRSSLQEKLPHYMIPSTFIFLQELPVTPNGKIDHKVLPTPDYAEQAREKLFIGPRDTLELQLTRIWEEVLGINPLSIKDDFFSLGGHSLQVVQMMSLIRQTLNYSLSLSSILEAPTIEHIASKMRSTLNPESWSPLVKLQPQGSKPPLFIVHGRGGMLMALIDLARLLDKDRPVYGLQARGLEEGQQPLDTIEALATYYRAAIKTVQPHGPYLIAGYSLGGLIAFEIAQQLLEQDQQTPRLLLLDIINADDQWLTNPKDDAYYWYSTYKKRLPSLTLDDLHKLDAEVQVDYVIDQFRIYDSWPTSLGYLRDPAYIRRFLLTQKAHIKAAHSYKLQRYEGPIILFRTTEATEEPVEDPTLGWNTLTRYGIEIHEVPGDHRSFLHPENVPYVAEALKDVLKRFT